MKSSEIATFVAGELISDADVEIAGVASMEAASLAEIAFVEKNIQVATRAGCLLVPTDYSYQPTNCLIKVEDPKLAFSHIATVLHPPKTRQAQVHSTAIISENAELGKDVFIGAFVCVGDASIVGDGSQLRAGAKVGDNVRIGKNCVLHANVFIEDGCTLGDNVILHAGVVVGADGFGYVRGANQYIKFPQIGTVIIDDDVEIGANSCIDRGALGETRIGEGTKIDNLVQIAHNVQIGKRVVIAAQTGISGSTIIEDDCVIGGQVGIGDHALVRSGAVIGSQAGVLPGKIVRQGIWWGTPVQPLNEYKIQNAHIKALGRLRDDVKALKKNAPNNEKTKNK